MVKTIAAAGVLAIAGSAVAAPFTVAGAQIAATGNFATPDIFPGTPAVFLLGAGEGVFYDSPAINAATPGAQGSTLIGAHPGAFPGTLDAAINPASGGVGALVAAEGGDNFAFPGDTSFNVGWTIPNAAAHVGSGVDANGFNSVWLARITGDNLQATLVQAIFSEDTGANITFELDGEGVQTQNGTLFAVSVPVPGGFDIILTDAPAPGAAALLGLAGVAGLRRRRA